MKPLSLLVLIYSYMTPNFNDIRFYSQWSSAVLMRTLWLVSVDIPAIITIPRTWKLQGYFRVLNRLYGPIKFSGPPTFRAISYDWSCDACVTCVPWGDVPWGWQNKRAWEQIVDIWPILLEFWPINDLLLLVTGRRWCRSLAKVTKWVKIEKLKLFFIIPKTISVIPYPYDFLVSYPLSLKLFCQLSLIPETPNRTSLSSLSFNSSFSFSIFYSFLWQNVYVFKIANKANLKSTLINEQVSVKKEKQWTRKQRIVKTITVATCFISV